MPVQPLVNPVIHLDQDKCWNHHWVGGFLHQLPAAGVGGIISVERGVQRARIQDQRHERGCGRSLPVR